MSNNYITQADSEVITQPAKERFVVTTVQEKVFLTQKIPGPPGPPGEPGPAGGSTLQRDAGATLSALVVVYEEDGEVFALDKDDEDHIDQMLGLTVTAASVGASLNVQRSGVVNNSGWAWTPGRVYLGAGGALTQTPASDGFDVLIGRAVSATRLLLDLQDPIELEN